MPLFRPERPAWLREKMMEVAKPLGEPFDPNANEYIMACTVSGKNPIFLIAWRAGDLNDAENTFLKWLDQGWARLDHTFFNEQRRYVFRTSAIHGFVAFRRGPGDLPYDDW